MILRRELIWILWSKCCCACVNCSQKFHPGQRLNRWKSVFRKQNFGNILLRPYSENRKNVKPFVRENPGFKPVEFDGFRKEAGLHAFTMSPSKWIESVNAIGITTKAGRYGGTYAHSDIALEFASWISAEFKLYIVKDYQRIKHDENSRLSLNWNLNREVAKLNYRIHTDAIKAMLASVDFNHWGMNSPVPNSIMDYGSRALEIEPGILTAYYWIIIAADETGNSMAREKFLQKAAEDLIDEENEKPL